MSGSQVFLVRLYLSGGSGSDIFVVSGGIGGINVLFVEGKHHWYTHKEVFLPITTCVLALGLFLHFLFLFVFYIFCMEKKFILSVLVSLVSSAHSLVAFEYSG